MTARELVGQAHPNLRHEFNNVPGRIEWVDATTRERWERFRKTFFVSRLAAIRAANRRFLRRNGKPFRNA